MTSSLAVEATGLVKHYGETVALSGVDIDVPTGTVTSVLGPNGAGKTTVVRILTTLAQATDWNRDRGRIRRLHSPDRGAPPHRSRSPGRNGGRAAHRPREPGDER
jgi:ABC-type multidrug transport system ATPase subunit